jgi:hypothetical protein
MDKLPRKTSGTPAVEHGGQWTPNGDDYNRLNDKVSEIIDNEVSTEDGSGVRNDAQDLLITGLQEDLTIETGRIDDILAIKHFKGRFNQGNDTISEGELTPGTVYQIFDYQAGDDFSNFGIANANGEVFVPGTLAGTVANTLANRVAVKQKDTVTLTGTGGAATISGAGDLSKTFSFDTLLATTATAFFNAHKDEYLTKGIVVTHIGDAIIFEAEVAGVAFTSPVITNVPFDLHGTNVATQPNVTAVKQKTTVTLTGTSGTAAITGAGFEARIVTWDTGLTETAAAFVTDFALDYSGVGITISSDGANIIFEADVAGTPFTVPTILNAAGNLDGTVDPTTANRVAVKQVDTLTLDGTIGSCDVTGTEGLTKGATFATSPTVTAAAFVTAHATSYLPNVVVTSDGADIIFTAAAAGTGFTSPAAPAIPGNMAGGVVPTQANVTAQAQVDTLSVTGDSGVSAVTGAGGFAKLLTFTTDLATTTAKFVTDHVTAYAGQGITITSNVADIIFTAASPGTSFTHPAINTEHTPLIWTNGTVLISGYEPVVLEWENTVGTITYHRESTGLVMIESDGLFTPDGVFIPRGNQVSEDGDIKITTTHIDMNTIVIGTYDNSVLTDGLLIGYNLEFSVHPIEPS